MIQVDFNDKVDFNDLVTKSLESIIEIFVYLMYFVEGWQRIKKKLLIR